jgi:hypothetical protein
MTSPHIKNDGELHTAIYFVVFWVMIECGCLEVSYKHQKPGIYISAAAEMIRPICSSKALVSICQTTQCHNDLENHSANLQHIENLNSYVEIIFLIF